MSDQWFWKHRGDVLGPLDTEQLEGLIRRHRVADRDELRLSVNSEWISGREVKRLFENRDQSTTSSEAAAHLLSQAGRVSEGTHNSPSRIERVCGALWGIVETIALGPLKLLNLIGEKTGNLLVGLLYPLRVFWNRQVLLIALTVIAAIVIIGQIQTGGNARNYEVVEELSAIESEFQSLRIDGASPEEFQAFRESALQQLDSTLKSMTSQSVQNPGVISEWFNGMVKSENAVEVGRVRKALIQATLALKTLLAERTEPNVEPQSAELFQKYMKVTRDMIEGHYQKRLEVRPYTNYSPSTPSTPSSPASPSGNRTLRLLLLGSVLILGGLGYWFRRKN